MSCSADLVILNNGTKVSNQKVLEVFANLTKLRDTEYVAFLDLVEKCRDQSYRFSTTERRYSQRILILKGFLLDNEMVPNDVRQIVLNSIQGKFFKIELISPTNSYVPPLKARITAGIKKQRSRCMQCVIL
jgi:hypothetical protein